MTALTDRFDTAISLATEAGALALRMRPLFHFVCLDTSAFLPGVLEVIARRGVFMRCSQLQHRVPHKHLNSTTPRG